MLEAFEGALEIGAENGASVDGVSADGKQQAPIALDDFLVVGVAMLGGQVFLIEIFLEGNQRSFSRGRARAGSPGRLFFLIRRKGERGRSFADGDSSAHWAINFSDLGDQGHESRRRREEKGAGLRAGAAVIEQDAVFVSTRETCFHWFTRDLPSARSSSAVPGDTASERRAAERPPTDRDRA